MVGVTTSGRSSPDCLRGGTGGKYQLRSAKDEGFILTKPYPTTDECMLDKMDGQMGEAICNQVAALLRLYAPQPIHITGVVEGTGIDEMRILQALCDNPGFRMDEAGRVWLPRSLSPEAQAILSYLAKHGATARSKLWAALDLSRDVVHDRVRKLMKGGYVEQCGAGRERYVSLVKK